MFAHMWEYDNMECWTRVQTEKPFLTNFDAENDGDGLRTPNQPEHMNNEEI